MYRIVITKEEDVVTTEQEWQQIYDSLEMAVAAGKEGTHAYVDKRVERVKQTQLLDQRVENIDLKRVISAVNDMPEVIPGRAELANGNFKGGDNSAKDDTTTEA